MPEMLNIESLKLLKDEELIETMKNNTSFLDGCENKNEIPEMFMHIFDRKILPIDFFIYYLNTNKMHLNDVSDLKDQISMYFLENNFVDIALKFNPSEEIENVLKFLKYKKPQKFNKKLENKDFNKFKMLSQAFEGLEVELLDDNYEFLLYQTFDLKGLENLDKFMHENTEKLIEDKTFFLLLKYKRIIKEKILEKISFSYCSYKVEDLERKYGPDSVFLMQKLILERKIHAFMENSVIFFE